MNQSVCNRLKLRASHIRLEEETSVKSKRVRITARVLITLLAGLLTWEGRASAQSHAVLVELFTSEGCSSCPPADALLRQLDGKTISSGQLVVGISEHVTYWNNLGWTDPFSASAYTDRQNSYGSRFRLDSVYTPQMVVNGERQVLGSDRDAILRAVRETDHSGALTVHIKSASVSGDTLVVRYSVRGDTARQDADLFAVVADDTDESQVQRGENSGRNLTHVSVARSITRIGSAKDTAETENTARLPMGNSHHSSARHLILFVQRTHLGPVLSVDTAALR
jgi:hypothetical protein